MLNRILLAGLLGVVWAPLSAGADGVAEYSTAAPSLPTTRAAARAKPRKKKRKKRGDPWARALRFDLGGGWRLEVPVQGRAWAGYLGGVGLQPDDGAAIGLGARARPRLRHRKAGFDLELDLDYAHRETVDARLAQRDLDIDLAAGWRPTKRTRLILSGGFAWRGRPGWLDLYQPRLDATGAPIGGWSPTDRFSRTAVSGRVGVQQTLSRRWTLGGWARLTDTVYARDPAFDAVLGPNHLTPGDNRRAALGARIAGRTRDKVLKGSLSLSASRTDWRYRFARDAGTGTTHAGIGGAPANPLQSFDALRVRPRISVWLKGLSTRLGLAGAWSTVQDRHAGYYSHDLFEVEASARIRPARGLKLELAGGPVWRRYTDRGYAEGPGHPALDDGDTLRETSRLWVEGRVAWTVWHKRATVFAEGRLTERTSNFPDYAPGVFPATRAYAIDWDADTWRTAVGVEFDLDP